MADTVPAAPPGTHVIPNISLEAFERAVYSRDHEQAGTLLLQGLRALKAGGDFIGYVPTPEVRALLYTRWCAATMALLADPAFGFSPEGFAQLAAEHATADLVWRASAFGTADHLLPQISDNPEACDPSQLRLKDGAALVKFLTVYSLRSSFALDAAATFARSPDLMLPLWAGMLATLLAVDRQAHARREALAGMHRLFEHAQVPDAAFPALSDAYMYLSYCTREDKHAGKATIHALFARALAKHAPPAGHIKALRKRGRSDALAGRRPVMLVCLEWFTGVHAMYRCYAPVMRQLRQRFYLVGMSRAGDIDDVGRAECDEWREVPADLNLPRLISQIAAIEPAAIYYPSLGMAMWWVALASIRLAPLQMMTLGHPASSRSPAMDVLLCDEGAIGDPALCTERIVEYPDGSARFIERHDAVLPKPQREDHPARIRIAVPAMLCKLNAPFLATLQRIDTESSVPLEWHLFPNMIGVTHHQAEREIQEWLPGAHVYPRAHFNEYAANLARCHIHLSTFPFGGTNSNIDSMRLGLPIVTRWGAEPHERFDGMMLRRAGLPDWLITHSEDEYVAAALRLITEDGTRNALRDQLLATDLHGLFFGSPPAGQETAVADAFWRVFCEHYGIEEPAHA